MQYGGNHLPPYYAVIAWGVTINFHKNYLVTNRPKPQIMKVIVQKPNN